MACPRRRVFGPGRIHTAQADVQTIPIRITRSNLLSRFLATGDRGRVWPFLRQGAMATALLLLPRQGRQPNFRSFQAYKRRGNVKSRRRRAPFAPTFRSLTGCIPVRTVVEKGAPVEEPDLIQRSRKGDRLAFAGLVERYWDRLYRWLYRLGHDQHQAEDVAQETLLKAFTALPSFTEGTRFQAWLFRIAFNTFLNQKKRSARVVLAFPDSLPANEAGPVEQLMSREALQELARAVGRLPGEFRAAFLLRAEEELSFREIAEVLGTSEETARWRVFKARQKLLEVMKEHLAENDG
jgi:RNA polymerase sigma-70 factor (ECF subfamily)